MTACDVEGYIALAGDIDAFGEGFGYGWFIGVALALEDGIDFFGLFVFQLCWKGVRLVIAISCGGPRQIS